MDDQDVNTAIVQSLAQHRWKLSIRAIQVAKDIAWNDLPYGERKVYLKHAEEAVLSETRKQ